MVNPPPPLHCQTRKQSINTTQIETKTTKASTPKALTPHRYQDIPNQPALVAPYARYTAELKHAAHTHALVSRALRMSCTASPGPTYLTATREVLAATTPLPLPSTSPAALHPSLGALAPSAVETIGAALLAAQHPLVVTGYLGRSSAAVAQLVALADALAGRLRVFDAEFREVSFPAGHRASVTRATGAAAAVRAADVVLLLDVDVPWIPAKVRPEREGVRVFHVDVDPRKERMGLFDVGAEGTWGAECEVAVAQLVGYVKEKLEGREGVSGERWAELGRLHEEGVRVLDGRAAPRADGKLSAAYLFRTLRRLLPADTVWVSDVVTNQVALSEQLRLDVPGTNFTKGGSGLGWSGGAAIGIKLATELYDTARERPCVNRREGGGAGNGRFVCSITGDGSFVFGAPSAVYWAQYQHKTPFLTVVVNNGGWKATRSCINDVHPDGLAAKTSDQGLGIDLRGDGPDYLGIAKAAAGGNLVTERVQRVEDLEEAIKRLAKEVLERGVGAVLEAIVA